ncbi:hypothetical protein B7P43_G10524 [Cryptotermes secundus]|uniref:Ionotropic glutamate receptor C-terminal domain-containing protein n=2 Tax=Cryptotermes secundus TaxID=105785 RepID=A0A2J7RC03_9NEOP|nr:hypothetical protein B7P43_G10524 [Cryptotermes secundus]
MKRPQWNMVLFVLGMAALCRSQTDKGLTLLETTAVIIGLQQYFRSGCVFFLYSNVRTDYELRDELMLVRLRKRLSQGTVTSAALDIDTGQAFLKHLLCPKNRPINVLASDDQNAMLSLKKDLPYVSLSSNPDGSHNMTGGFFGLVWKDFEEKLNFKTNFTYLEPGLNKYEVDGRKTDPYNKMVADVRRRKYDIAVAALHTVSERAKIVDYTYLMHRSKFVIVMKPAANEDMAWNHFFGPFHPSLWFGLIACILVIAGCLSLFHYVGQRLAYPEYETPKQYTFLVSIFYVFSMFCQQGHDVTPKSCACRLVYWLGYVTAVVVLAAYSATLISFLTIQNKEPPVKTLEALAKDRSYELGMMEKYLRIIRGNSEHGITKEIYESKIVPDPKNIVNTSLEGLQRVCNAKYAFWTSVEAVKEVGDSIDCNIAFLTYSHILNLAMIVTYNNPYRRLINHQ